MNIVQPDDFAYNFIPKEFLPRGKDEYYIRNQQNKNNTYRHVTYDEVEALIRNGNSCTNWNDVLVSDPFNPQLIKGSTFAGLVRLGKMDGSYLKYHDYIAPIGITNSRIIACDIGENCAIQDCRYLAHYIIESHVILSCIDEMSTTNHSKFGEGVIKDGEPEQVRISISVLNEAGGREVLPFSNMIPADAFLWARYRDDTKLIKQLERITTQSVDRKRGYYGVVQSDCCIKSCRIIKDVNFGPAVYAKGCNKLKNLTIKSSFEEPTQLGEGIELVNGIVGLGSRIFYGVKAIRFVVGTNCELKYGARLVHSILGDNSTISCCEVLNALIFPFHEQHHNNSFLIASLIQGQSNMAAGATVGSNHNSRSNDGELIAGRGFWPGLCATLKQNSRFASFMLISKANYKYELDVPFPFSLVSDEEHEGTLEIMCAYYWMYNMYSLERNNKKFLKRDRRVTKTQIIETDYLLPDTVIEIMNAMELLKKCFVQTWKLETGKRLSADEMIQKHFDELKAMEVFADGIPIERSKRPVLLMKAAEGYKAYQQMLVWYGVKTIAAHFKDQPDTLKSFLSKTKGTSTKLSAWVNVGGQLISETRLDLLREEIRNGTYKTWDEIHAAYHKIHEYYAQDCLELAVSVLLYATGATTLTVSLWNQLLEQGCDIADYIAQQVYSSKYKDYVDGFRNITYRNKAEKKAVLSTIDKNELVQQARLEAEQRKVILKQCLIKAED